MVNMSMPDLHRQLDDDGSKKPLSDDLSKSKRSPLTPSSQQAKHWAKKYRTEIAAGSSSVLSTFAAVGIIYHKSRDSGARLTWTCSSLWIPSKPECRRALKPVFQLQFVLVLNIHSYRFNHFTDCVQHTYKTEGFKGFWRGTCTS